MHLAAATRIRAGIASNTCTLIRSTGDPVHVPRPLYELGDGMVAIPHAELDTDDRVVLDLNTWALRDMERERSIDLVIYGPPDGDLMSRIATRYVREARALPQHELTAWAQQVRDETAA